MSQSLSITLITYHDGLLKIAETKEGIGDLYQRLAARVWLSPDDLEFLGVSKQGTVELKNDVGSIVVEASSDPNSKPGIGYMPFSLYSLSLMDYDSKIGLPNFKKIEVTVMPTDQNITPVSEIKGRRLG